ncbi:hypothetical protein HK100_010547, partial [Physocladia obscura]
ETESEKDAKISKYQEIESLSESLNAQLHEAIEENSALKLRVEKLRRENENLAVQSNEKDLLMGKMKSDALKMGKRLEIVEKNLEIQIAQSNRRLPDMRSSPVSRASIVKNEVNRSSILSTTSDSNSLDRSKRVAGSKNKERNSTHTTAHTPATDLLAELDNAFGL